MRGSTVYLQWNGDYETKASDVKANSYPRPGKRGEGDGWNNPFGFNSVEVDLNKYTLVR